MDEKLNELKEKQAEIGDKISLLQATNKKKDEEAAEIRQLIAECRENLNRIKGLAPGSEAGLAPCPEYGEPADTALSATPPSKESGRPSPSTKQSRSRRDSDSSRRDSIREGESRRNSGNFRKPESERDFEYSDNRAGERDTDSVRSNGSRRNSDLRKNDSRSEKEKSESGRDDYSGRRSESGRDDYSGRRSESGRDADSIRSNRSRRDSESSRKNESDRDSKSSGKKSQELPKSSETTKSFESKKTDSACEELLGSGRLDEEESTVKSEDRAILGKPPCTPKTKVDINKKRCAEIVPKPECIPPETKKKKGRDGERVSCKVDLNKMKVRIRGPSEDLKKLDATQLINLLEKFQCQELIINTGEEIIQDPGEIRLVYFLHPGNIVMVAGIIMIAFLINTNFCNVENSCRTKFLLKVLYISSFAFHYGMVFWMSFIRGFALKFGLNRDTYILVDNLVLPKYYSICVLLSALSLYSFLATHCVAPCTSWPLEVLAQMILAVVTFVMELITICYIIPALVKLRDATEDYTIDDEEPECSPPESYEKNLIKLSKLNWTVCLINVLTLIFLGANMYYMSKKLDIGDN